MRFVEFTEVQMRQVEGKVQVASMPRIIVAEHITSVAPGAIPSEVTGPQGQMVMKPAAYVCLPGERVLVTCTLEEALWKIKTEEKKIKKPEKKESSSIIS